MALGKKTGGRKKGTPNKVTASLRDDVLEAFKEAGGVKYLVKHAEENPQLFIPLIAKVLPKETINQHEHNGDLFTDITLRVVDGSGSGTT